MNFKQLDRGIKNSVDKVRICFDNYDGKVDVAILKNVLETFNKRYSCDALNALDGDELLERMFFTTSGHDNMAYFLEYDNHSTKYFGSIKGGISFKYGLFQSRTDGQWKSNAYKGKTALTNPEALEQGKKILSELNQANEIIKEFISKGLKDVKEYEALEKRLIDDIGNQAVHVWRHKYFTLMYPDYFSVYHSDEWQKHVLYAIGIEPSDTRFGRSGQMTLIRKHAGIKSHEFHEAIYNFFGAPKKFCRIGTSDNGKSDLEDLISNKSIGLGWNRLGSLENYIENKALNNEKLKKVLLKTYYPDTKNKGIATRKSKEIILFYNSDKNTIFVPASGEHIIGFASNVGEYYFDESKLLGHRKHCEWELCFKEGQKLPYKEDGTLTSCHEFKNVENILFLYDRYYFGKGSEQGKRQLIKHEEDELIYSHTVNEEPIEEDYDIQDIPEDAQEAIIVKGVKQYKRDYKVGKYALKLSNYSCEMDPEHKTFISRSSGKAYLEPHHLIPISEQENFTYSLDVPANVVALCSNCHNEIHYGINADVLIKKLYESRKERLEKAGIEITIEELLEMYK